MQSLVQEGQDPLGLLVHAGTWRGHQVLFKVPLDRPGVGGGSQVGTFDVSFLSAFD